jgi:hypothetical protein
MSAFGGKADIGRASQYVVFALKASVSECQIDDGTDRISELRFFWAFKRESPEVSYRSRTYVVPVSWRHSFTAAARRLSI